MRIFNLGSRVVNAYLVELKEGWLLVDTGYPEGFASFLNRLRRHKIDLGDLKYILITHAHDDHVGFLNNLLCRCEARVILHEKAAGILARGQNSFAGGCTGKLALQACKAMNLFGKQEHRFPPVDAAFEQRYLFLTEHATATVLLHEVSGYLIETPGHTGCSISLLLNSGQLFCGDAAMNGFPSVQRTTIWAEDMEAYAASWEKIISLQPSVIYPGHGKPMPVSDLERYLPQVRRTKLLKAY